MKNLDIGKEVRNGERMNTLRENLRFEARKKLQFGTFIMIPWNNQSTLKFRHRENEQDLKCTEIQGMCCMSDVKLLALQVSPSDLFAFMTGKTPESKHYTKYTHSGTATEKTIKCCNHELRFLFCDQNYIHTRCLKYLWISIYINKYLLVARLLKNIYENC